MMSTSEDSLPELTSQDIQSYEKKTSFNLNSKVSGMQLLDSGLIALFTFNGVKILKITAENKFEVVKELPEYKDMGQKISTQDDDGCLIFSSGNYKDNFKVLDKDFNLLQDGGAGSIETLCKLSDSRISQANNEWKLCIFTKVDGKYEYTEGYTSSQGNIASQIYFPQQNLIVNGNFDKSISVFDLAKGEFVHTIEDAHGDPVTALIRLDDEHFASGGRDFKVKRWSISEILNGSKEAMSTQYAHDQYDGECMKLTHLAGKFYVSACGFYFKVWGEWDSWRTFEEDARVQFVSVTKSRELLVVTDDNNIHLWK